jgi:3-oxoacyl-[acyl-carrier-protein] synthase-1
MRRVVVTGMGIVSSIGNSLQEVTNSLYHAKSGIAQVEEYRQLGFRSHVAGTVKLNLEEVLDRRTLRFMGGAAAYTFLAMQQAIKDAGLQANEVSNELTGLVVGSGGPSTSAIVKAADTVRKSGVKRVGPTQVPKAMSSTCSANLAVQFKIKGISYSISSACATSAHCIGNAAEIIQLGKQDIMFAGGGEEMDWTFTALFDAMGALSSHYNENPHQASRPFDMNRDGFVISCGGGILVLEELEHARARGARIYAELAGYAATTDGADMVAPSGEGAQRCLRLAIRDLDIPVDYINAHATSTTVGDIQEVGAIKAVFGEESPVINSTKSLTGHAQGAAGVHEAIYSLLMLDKGFVSESANISELDSSMGNINIARTRIDMPDMQCVISNSFGFGGTNASLLFRKV